MRIAIGIEYDGTSFHGWQTQPDGLGIQDAVSTAIGKIALEAVEVTAAGRTDAGVHATSQVAHFDIQAERPNEAWVRGVNSGLPRSVAVTWARPVAEEFHARFAARGRHYSYILINRPTRSALLKDSVGWTHRPLDIDAMREASKCLLGEHDFSAFRSSECQAKSATRTIYEISFIRIAQFIRMDFHANAFLHHMARNMVGSFLYVGDGRRQPDWLQAVLASADRGRAAPTASPNGLYLTGVDYESKWGLPTTHVPLILPLSDAANS